MRRTLRAVALFGPLPRVRWRPGEDAPFVDAAAAARSPDLRADLDVLERELVPRFRTLDRESLQAQNTFRLTSLAIIAGGAVASILGAVQTGLGGGVAAIGVVEAVLAGILSATVVYARGRGAQREYSTKRVKAERLRAEYFLFLARSAEYADCDDGARVRRLRARIRSIESQQEPG